MMYYIVYYIKYLYNIIIVQSLPLRRMNNLRYYIVIPTLNEYLVNKLVLKLTFLIATEITF